MMNLCISDNPYGAFLPNHYYLIVGDSASGKTWLSLTAFAEACRDERFSEYRLIYDNVENGALMDWDKYFGTAVRNRVEAPRVVDGENVYSETVEQFYYHVDDATKEGRPFVYVLDSMDGLTSDQSADKFEDDKKADRQGKDTSGSYGDGKAKVNSQHLRQVVSDLKKTGSILIVLAQTRDNLKFGPTQKTYSGGRALKFYATVELWTDVVKKLTKTHKNTKLQVGTVTRVRTKKNRISGKDRSASVPIYLDLGLDDVGSCIDFMLECKCWSQRGRTITAPEFEFTGTRDKLIEHIESNDLEDKLSTIVGGMWREIESACTTQRKKRY